MRDHIFVNLFLLLASGLCVVAEAEPDPGSMDFAGRKQYLLSLAAAEYDRQGAKPGIKQAFWIAEALMELHRDGDAMKLANAALENLEPGNKINRWLYGGNTGFTAWPALDFYLRYKDRLDDPTRARYARIYKGAIFYRRLTTSNHTLMAATERYLATQEWGDHFAPDPQYVSRPMWLAPGLVRTIRPVKNFLTFASARRFNSERRNMPRGPMAARTSCLFSRSRSAAATRICRRGRRMPM